MEKVCVFCKTSEINALHFGGLKRTGGIDAHYFCALMSTSITQSGRDREGILGFLDKDIKTVVENCKMIKCVYCGKFGATISCFKCKCKRNFHFPCGLRNMCSFTFSDNFETFCDVHNHYPKHQRSIVENMTNMICIACLQDIQSTEKEEEFLTTPCCKLHLIHIECARLLAFNAGYFTKCPVCNNIEQFAEGLRHCGVFVPLQDASWEQPRGAYSELTSVQRSCDMSQCRCPHGKHFETQSGKWMLIRCNDCGSSAAHKGCVLFNPYLCDTCIIVARKISTAQECERQAKRMKYDSSATATY